MVLLVSEALLHAVPLTPDCWQLPKLVEVQACSGRFQTNHCVCVRRMTTPPGHWQHNIMLEPVMKLQQTCSRPSPAGSRYPKACAWLSEPLCLRSCLITQCLSFSNSSFSRGGCQDLAKNRHLTHLTHCEVCCRHRVCQQARQVSGASTTPGLRAFFCPLPHSSSAESAVPEAGHRDGGRHLLPLGHLGQGGPGSCSCRHACYTPHHLQGQL